MPLSVFTCDDHDGRWPVGTASVVVANDETEARELLRTALVEAGLKPDDFTLKPLDLSAAHAVILRDGDY